ncbi:bifunctional [glutamate--ammonia ligase]-adenylyl-L-tyrosine phosphorylase/[glutamate--ammonia-ligase] adenylyltransferase [Shewanella sp. NIFS-20-20]|uniref:bifunctional [glutamate--ammonia ligase]-adenylyl-L-tyrosine phosphorylase/[glutamate--ammonia-ligase] adenylyltransferase n=1 Tax=Shewanella sp. NIFS-20-20 TaxID=2853806 RepID=UPI001C4409C6|nr:bifunctional [glutamate--ammonia ligase]-adenylyl-L-tyrosine phosphorylase/[glutamate--ammonia-ligase] adenylyltransferase [Shewanella sp. NIFS-20-20]MBV7314684.1 bifunctional [glutamate--ammonia ligase]-adenylyl-L-tyrosine phosphorylase/[glutamate--ammonia-ligase] adenylyltransferase [Shewanella sp. NIFS-20-20]
MAGQTLCNDSLPEALSQLADERWQQLLASAPATVALLDVSAQAQTRLMLALSDFIHTQIMRHPEWLLWLHQGGLGSLPRQSHAEALARQLANADDDVAAKRIMRQYRNLHMVRLAWLDFANQLDIEEQLVDLSVLAESLIIAARDWAFSQLCQQYGTPTNSAGAVQPLMILGMGKLGGRELNFSSDIDLIFTFPEHGETEGGRRPLDNQQFFIRMGQRLVDLLHDTTVDGFVYRVDMRLRPYGESGPLVVSYSALEDYYQEQGRDWERYAMVKARALGPWSGYSDELHQLLRPFVYRRYIDYSAIDALRKMKAMIAREVRRRQLTDNIKLGAGGIREVEFVVQSLQLIRGGREPSLRQQSIFAALKALHQCEQLSFANYDELKSSYIMLRRVENILQAIADQQTQTLPDNPLDWQRLCVILARVNVMDFRTHLEAAMNKIHQHFRDTVGGESVEESEHWTQALWQERDVAVAQELMTLHHNDDDDFLTRLHSWRQQAQQKPMGPRGVETLDKLMPKLLDEVLTISSPTTVFKSISKVLDSILTRTTYLELLCENPGARSQLVTLCSASPWIAKQLSRFPMLLDELIEPSHLYDIGELSEYGALLRQSLLRVAEDDMEQQMEYLRQFKLAQQLKIAAADVTGVLPVMKVSDHLTYLAEAIVSQVARQAWQQITARYGQPPGLNDGDMGFAVIAYGKLGGIELGYGSDLDLVFLHNADLQAMTNGEKAIECGHFYLKLAQRILHLFSTRTNSGELYEVDMRLRPSGSSGLMVSQIERFGEYHCQEAWTWEHQALVRARCIVGDDDLCQRFKAVRAQVIALPRSADNLASEVHQMRLKMRQHLLKVAEGEFDLKQSAGGIADIEFIAQYLVLLHGHQFPELAIWSDNVRIFELLAQLGLLPQITAEQLVTSYCLLRDESHRLTLLGLPGLLPALDVADHVEHSANIYQLILAHPAGQERADPAVI